MNAIQQAIVAATRSREYPTVSVIAEATKYPHHIIYRELHKLRQAGVRVTFVPSLDGTYVEIPASDQQVTEVHE